MGVGESSVCFEELDEDSNCEEKLLNTIFKFVGHLLSTRAWTCCRYSHRYPGDELNVTSQEWCRAMGSLHAVCSFCLGVPCCMQGLLILNFSVVIHCVCHSSPRSMATPPHCNRQSTLRPPTAPHPHINQLQQSLPRLTPIPESTFANQCKGMPTSPHRPTFPLHVRVGCSGFQANLVLLSALLMMATRSPCSETSTTSGLRGM